MCDSMKHVTLEDVARHAGVSLATASRVLTTSAYPVSESLRARVRKAATELDYVPNIAARSLRGAMNDDIGVVMPNLSNPFYLQMMQGISGYAYERGAQMIVCNTMRSPEREHRFFEALFTRRVLRVVLSSVDRSAETVSRFIERGMEFVLVTQWLPGATCAMIQCDIHSGAYQAVRHLLDNGHRRIALATPPLWLWSRGEIYRGYCQALTEVGLPIDLQLVFEATAEYEMATGDFDIGIGGALAQTFVQQRRDATAVLCANDMLAFGFIRALNDAGLRVPEDVSVVGFDDIPMAELFHPPLTTVRYPALEAGRLSAMMLLDARAADAERKPLAMQLTPVLVRRETVAAPR